MNELKFKYYFDKTAADKAIRFIETYCTHVKGERAGEPIILEEWQKEDIIRPIFGWKHRGTKLRRYRKIYVEIPRKNAKSTLAAAMALLLLSADDEPGAEVYSAAADRGQAGIVHDVARRMVENNEQLYKRLKVFRNSITYEKSGSFYKAISADANTKHGFNAHGIIFDELHTQPNRELYDTLITSVGSRRQPLTILLTTAGYDKNTICFEMHEYARKVTEGIIEDETFLSLIYSAPMDMDIFSEETWRLANPGFGTIVKADYIREQVNTIKNNPSYENTFRRLHLNQWTSAERNWLPDDRWELCNQGMLPNLKGRECYAGLDLASVRDITALVLIFPPLDEEEPFHVLCFFWVPSLTAKDRRTKDGVNYDEWIRLGFIEETPGDVTDFAFVRERINVLQEEYDLMSVGFDPWNSSQLGSELVQDGIRMAQFRQGYASMSEPTKELERMIMSAKINHAGNPVLRWMNSNVSMIMDPAGNIKINKAKSTDKVDGMVSLVMAIGEYMSKASSSLRYNEEGIRSV